MSRNINPSVVNHIEHLDDLVMYSPELTLQHLKKVKDGTEEYTLKWDGSPSIVFGKIGGTAFVSTKSFFNKTPVLYESFEDITAANLSAELTLIMFIALNYAKVLSVQNIAYQGDVMFCPGNKVHTGSNIEFGLNLVKYNVSNTCSDYNAINKAKLGIAVHTRYSVSFIANKMKVTKCKMSYVPKGNDDVYIFDSVKGFIKDQEGWTDGTVCDELIEYVEELQNIRLTLKNHLDLYHECFRKFKTYCLAEKNQVIAYVPDEFEKICFQHLSTKLFDSKSKTVARANALNKMLEFNQVLDDAGMYFWYLVKFTSLSQDLVKLNMLDLKTDIKAQHEGLVVSTNEYVVKYVDKLNFTKRNNAKRNNKSET